jgi:hypothetical protein
MLGKRATVTREALAPSLPWRRDSSATIIVQSDRAPGSSMAYAMFDATA